MDKALPSVSLWALTAGAYGYGKSYVYCNCTGWHKKRELSKNPTKIEEIQEKKIIDRNWTITTCLLRDSNPKYQCLKITSCRWRPPPRMHYFTATTHFKSYRSFVSPCVCCMLCRMRQSINVWKLRPVDGVLLHVCILSLPLRISKVPVLLCHPVCVACSAECDRVAFCRACNTHTHTHTHSDTKERELLKCVVAVKECIRGGGRHLQDVIFKHW